MAKFLFLMGGSGCGKTTLAKKLEEYDSDKYYRNIEYGTRDKRPGEIDGYDYFFVSRGELLDLYENNKLFESVITQFPDMYGCNYDQIKEDKINVMIVCLEGFLTAKDNLNAGDSAVLVNIINDCPLDIDRNNRDPLQEERINRMVLKYLSFDNLLFFGPGGLSIMEYIELPLSKLKEIRNDKEKCLEYFNGLFKRY